jgi:hypothetical protein
MTLAVILGLSLFCVGVCAAADGSAPLACNIKAISAAERPRYNDLIKRLRIAFQDRSELADGYAYKLDTKKMTLPEVAEWITMERLCCPFLRFQLDVKANGDSQLALRGPDGTKPVLREEFPEKSK